MYIIYRRTYEYESKSFTYRPGKEWNYRFSVGFRSVDSNDKNEENETTHGLESNSFTDEGRRYEDNGTDSKMAN